MMMKQLVIAAALMAAGSANADTITQWNFNSVPADTSTSTGTLTPNIGAGVISLLNGVTTTGFNSGVGSSDTASDNTGFQTTTYAAQGAQNELRGVQYNVSTVGFSDITVSYDLRHSNTSSRYEQFQYSIDGTNFTDFALFDGNVGDAWFNRSVDLSSIAGADNNASFSFRVVAAFAPTTAGYLASNPTSNYAGGTWRFDAVTVSGATVAAVPEPESYALLVAGLGFVGFASRRRQSV
ncbi:MAG: PEP-CTERM sorting domain-containing protein [Methylotenera sp.]|nr:MAG: PEP-CTERM sorting domain-containing protein [Methylotenera sp.]